ncbi:UNC93-like protein MFSD11 [Cimex lectularius]|uniref:UNC93-like protein MFSD11 n=1 Tax=Cimex lectularius TaxID=79782 RepID=A0A8I6S5T9_CIMLE|nr:UNC93-like protein MFSD11 [Cimex lectularius]
MFFNKVTYEVLKTVHLGFSFLLLFSADFTFNNLMPTMYKRISFENPSFSIDGFTGLGGLYFVYGITLWLAPSINSVIGPRMGMVIGAVFITFHISIVEFELVWLIYLGILFSGFGGSILWVGEGNYIVLNSKNINVTRHVCIFWVLYTGSMIVGNLYMTLHLHNATDLDRETRALLLRILTGIGLVSAVSMCFLRTPTAVEEHKIINEGPLKTLVQTFKLYLTPEMRLLFLTFIYAGFQQSFGWSIYETCVGFTKSFGPRATELVPLSGLTYGVGNSLGGAFHMIIAKKVIIKCQRGLIICVSGVLQIIALFLTFLNLPNESVFGPTSQVSVIEPSVGLALGCGFILGFGDSCINTQIFSLLAHIHPDHSANTSALYKFTKCMAMAGFFFIGISLGLHYQILVIVVMAIGGSIAFFLVDYKTCSRIKNYPVCADQS